MSRLDSRWFVTLALSACTVDSSSGTFGVGSTTGVTSDDASTSSTSGAPDPGSTGGSEDSDASGEPGDASSSSGSEPEPEPPTACPALGEWTASAPFLDGSGYAHPLPSFAIDDRVYVHTVIDGDRRLRMATLTDGALSPWSDASPDHGGGPHGFHALVDDQSAYHFRNGHIAEYVFDEQGAMVGDVVLLEDSADTAFGGDRYVWDAATVVAFEGGPRWVFHLGGFSFTPYAYVQTVRRNQLPLGPVFEDTGVAHPGGRPGHSAAFVPPGADAGWIFTTHTGEASLWRASVDRTGALGSWESAGTLPTGDDNGRGDLFVVEQSAFLVRGSQVYRAVLGLDGSLSAWADQPGLPQPQVDLHWGDGHTEGASWGVIDQNVFVTGPDAVFIAPFVDGACG